MGKTIKNEKRGKGRVPGKSARERLAKYQRLSPTRSAIFQTAAQIFELMRVLDENNMDKKKTAKDMGICYQTVNRYEAKYWTEYEAKKKIDIEEAERRARATLVTYDNPEELTVEVVDNNIEKVRTIINDHFLLSMDEMKRRMLDPMERKMLSSRDLTTHIANLLPYLTFKIGEMTQPPGTLQANKDEFVQKFIETMTGSKQKSMNQ